MSCTVICKGNPEMTKRCATQPKRRTEGGGAAAGANADSERLVSTCPRVGEYVCVGIRDIPKPAFQSAAAQLPETPDCVRHAWTCRVSREEGASVRTSVSRTGTVRIRVLIGAPIGLSSSNE